MSESDAEVDCPLGCGYCGAPRSVEAHISRKTDERHKGEVGRAYRDVMTGATSSTPVAEEIDAETAAGDSSKTLAAVGAVGAALFALSRVVRP